MLEFATLKEADTWLAKQMEPFDLAENESRDALYAAIRQGAVAPNDPRVLAYIGARDQAVVMLSALVNSRRIGE